MGFGLRGWLGRFKDEPGDIRSAPQLDPDGKLSIRCKVVLGQLLSYLICFDADNGIAPRVVIDWAPEHLGPDGSLMEAVGFPIQGSLNDQLKKVLRSFAICKLTARFQLPEMKAH